MFGIPGTDAPTSTGPFLGRVQHDARNGSWKYVRRVQQSDGGWDDDESEPFNKPSFLVDFWSFEAGWIKLTSPPAWVVAPYGQAPASRPDETFVDETSGKTRKSFSVGFRVKVYNPKLFGDKDAYYFSNNSIAVTTPMDELLRAVVVAPEFIAGKIPLVEVTGRKKNEYAGGNVTYSPVFVIKGWYDRVPSFGERTVALGGMHQPATEAPPKANGGARHVQAPVANAPENDWEAGPPAGHPVNAPPVDDIGAAGVWMI